MADGLKDDLRLHAFDDCGGEPPDTHVCVMAADRITQLEALLEQALPYVDECFGDLDRGLAAKIAALTGENRG